MPTSTIQVLLTRFIDYAGLFPPARLGMAAAVREFARYHRGDKGWLLGRFVVPVTRLGEFQSAALRHLPQGRARRPWLLSVLVEENFNVARERIDAFNRAYAGRAAIDSVEVKPVDAEEIARAARAFESLKIFYELRTDKDPGPLMAAVKTLGGRAKIRTGGETPGSIPSPAEVLRFLGAAQRSVIPLKATAGLHHPMRGEYCLTYEEDSPKATMFGFLGFFLAGAWLYHENFDQASALALLEERSPEALSFSDHEVCWQEHRLTRDDLIEARRSFVLSCGSCSIEEPVRELRALKLV